MTELRKLNFVGSQQTCYSDWARCVVESYPYNPAFKYDKNDDVVSVYSNSEKVGEYKFSAGTGYLMQPVNKKTTLKDVGKFSNFQEISIDSLIQKD